MVLSNPFVWLPLLVAATAARSLPHNLTRRALDPGPPSSMYLDYSCNSGVVEAWNEARWVAGLLAEELEKPDHEQWFEDGMDLAFGFEVNSDHTELVIRNLKRLAQMRRTYDFWEYGNIMYCSDFDMGKPEDGWEVLERDYDGAVTDMYHLQTEQLLVPAAEMGCRPHEPGSQWPDVLGEVLNTDFLERRWYMFMDPEDEGHYEPVHKEVMFICSPISDREPKTLHEHAARELHAYNPDDHFWVPWSVIFHEHIHLTDIGANPEIGQDRVKYPHADWDGNERIGWRAVDDHFIGTTGAEINGYWRPQQLDIGYWLDAPEFTLMNPDSYLALATIFWLRKLGWQTELIAPNHHTEHLRFTPLPARGDQMPLTPDLWPSDDPNWSNEQTPHGPVPQPPS